MKEAYTTTDITQAAELLKQFLASRGFDPNGSYTIDYLTPNLVNILNNEIGPTRNVPPSVMPVPQAQNQPSQPQNQQSTKANKEERLPSGELIIRKASVYPLFIRPGSPQIILTEKRVVLQSGMLNVSERSIPLSKITDVTVKADIKGNMMNYGTLCIESAGSSGTEIVAENINDAKGMRTAILGLLS